MRIASWNVNSVRARLPNVLSWLRSARPDVLLLQEIKCEEAQFPAEAFQDEGYGAAVLGQKTYNGVAILARDHIEIERRGLPGDADDEQARYLEALVGGVRVASLYVPNGNPAPGPKFDYKLAWLDRLAAHAAALMALEEVTVLGGDYNICPTDADVHDPLAFAGDALCLPAARDRFFALTHRGWTDAYRLFDRAPGRYTYWDYQAGAWPRDLGLRIDHFLLSPQAVDRLAGCGIDKAPRGAEKASDHTPVWIELR